MLEEYVKNNYFGLKIMSLTLVFVVIVTWYFNLGLFLTALFSGATAFLAQSWIIHVNSLEDTTEEN